MLNENDNVNDLDSREQQAKPVREGQPAGGQKFGEDNNTPSGDDKNNPSENAGYTNEYFRRTEPSEEHPENTNFKPAEQEGEPDYDSAQPYSDKPSE